jgi:energy-coupling factor transport system ATP-binding protein
MSYNQIILDDISAGINGKMLLQNIALQIPRGQITSIIGASGSGKTTFLKLILDLLFAEKGWQVTGNATRFPGLKMAYINQNPALQVFKNFVYEEFSTLAKSDVAELLSKMGCSNLLEKRCLELSQGEKTIVAVLRALSLNVDLLVFDEVMVNLSHARREWLKQVIVDFKTANGTVLLADHCPMITDFADHILLVAAGKIVPISKMQADLFFTGRQEIATKISLSNNFIANNTLEICAIVDELLACSSQKSICFTATNGEIIGINGDNGSGKTTLLEIICGIKKVAQGAVLWNGTVLKRLSSRKKIMTLCAAWSTQQFLTNNVQSELELTVPDINCSFSQRIIETFYLHKLIGRNIEALSYGQKQRLAIVIAMLSNAKVLIFDEPTYGMDRDALQAFVRGLQFLAANGKIIIMASHETALLSSVTSKIINL